MNRGGTVTGAEAMSSFGSGLGAMLAVLALSSEGTADVPSLVGEVMGNIAEVYRGYGVDPGLGEVHARLLVATVLGTVRALREMGAIAITTPTTNPGKAPTRHAKEH